MMQRIWAGIIATWAVIAIFAVLAFSQRPPAPASSGVVLARSASGKLVPVAPSGGVSHATTGSSSIAASGATAQPVTYVKTTSGSYVPVSSTSTTAAAVTRSS
jgi:hypothetical protein